MSTKGRGFIVIMTLVSASSAAISGTVCWIDGKAKCCDKVSNPPNLTRMCGGGLCADRVVLNPSIDFAISVPPPEGQKTTQSLPLETCEYWFRYCQGDNCLEVPSSSVYYCSPSQSSGDSCAE